MTDRTKEEIVKDIKTILDEKVAPAVAQHNGFINYLDFDKETGVVKLQLAGACSGCAMSKITLHQGVEDMLKHYVPEVQAIVGEDDVEAKAQGYSPFVPSNELPDVEAAKTVSEQMQDALEPIDAIDNLTGTEELDKIDSLTTENQKNIK
jgi:Fe-S cluster biogenesis protein NfuA